MIFNRKRNFIFILAAMLLYSPIFDQSAFAQGRINYSYIYSVSKSDYIKHVDKTNNSVDVISPNYYDLSKDGGLVITANFDSKFITEMHNRGVKVVPFLSNHWDKNSGLKALNNAEALTSKIASEIKKYNLDGINIDMEGLSHTERESFTNFIKLLNKKIPADKELSVAVAANPKGLTKGWHGSYDYKALANYADYLIIMAYDESYGGSDPGPVASIDFVEQSIQYALNQEIANNKIILGVPFYGRIWRLEDLETRKGVVGDGIWMDKTASLLENYGGVYEYDQAEGSFVGRVTIKESDPPFRLFSWKEPLKPGNYEIWFDKDQSIKAKLDLVNKYNLKGTANWSLGQESSSLWAQYKTWLNSTAVASGNSSNGSWTQPATRIDVIINGETLAFEDEAPLIQAGRTLVPLRGIFEALGAAVQWDAATKEINATDGNNTIWLKADSNITTVNGETKTIEVPAQIINGRTMVPLRFVGESFDAAVNWENDTRSIIISN